MRRVTLSGILLDQGRLGEVVLEPAQASEDEHGDLT
jgi:hypothetical protein